jgi:hypothetical protein
VNGDVGPGQAFAEDMDLAFGITHPQGAVADEASKQIGQQTHVAVLRDRRKSLSPKEGTRCRTKQR